MRAGPGLAVAVQLLLTSSVAAAAAAPDGAFSSASSLVQAGHWLELRGRRVAQGLFVSEDAEVVAAEETAEIVAVLERVDERRLQLLGREVLISPNTRLKSGLTEDLVGKRVKVEGTFFAASGRFIARKVSPREPGRTRLTGRVERVAPTASGVEVEILGLTARLPAVVTHERRLIELVEPATSLRGPFGGASEDDILGPGIPLGRSARLSGRLDGRAIGELDHDLSDETAENRLDSRVGARLRLDWLPRRRVYGVAEALLGARWRDDEGSASSSDQEAQLGEAFLLLGEPLEPGLTVQIGRQDFDETREWLYDQNLDAVRLTLSRLAWRLEASLGATLSDGSRRDESSTDAIVYLANQHRKRHLAAYAVYRDFGAEFDERRLHVGARAIGRWLPNARSWLELAFYRGSYRDADADGWAVDAGATWTPDLIEPLSVTVGYAFGSGSVAADGSDRSFRQTGLQDNNWKFAGVTSFRYYGELADPELSNLHIATVGLGARVGRKTSVDLVYHHYRQDEAAPRWIDSDLDRRPNGIDRAIGHEVDLIVGSRRWDAWDLELVGALFLPGAAFEGDAASAWLTKAQVRWRF